MNNGRQTDTGQMGASGAKLLASLQAGRAIAAIAVVCCHAEQFARQFIQIPDAISAVMSKGYLGVDFFFALSGFIIYYSNYNQVGLTGWSGRYIWARLTRIFVPYLPIGIMLGVAYELQPQLAGTYDWGWFSTLTLLPSSHQPSLAVAWTLQHEIIFYGVMLVLLRTGYVLPGCAMWLVAIIAAEALGWHAIGLSIIDIEFIAGVAAAAYFVRRPRARPSLFGFLGVTFCAGAIALGLPDARVMFGFGMALLILYAVLAESAGHWRTPAILLTLGEASYAIYLIHVPAMRLAARVVNDRIDGLLLPLLICIGIAVGVAYHVVIERRGLAMARQLLGYSPGTRRNHA